MDPKYFLGIPELDTQHEEIDQVVKSLSDAIGGKDSPGLIPPLLVRLHELLQVHFSDEESVMGTLSYPLLSEHQSAHRKILGKLEDFKNFLEQAGGLDVIETSVQKMFEVDVIRHDRMFAEFVRAHGGFLNR